MRKSLAKYFISVIIFCFIGLLNPTFAVDCDLGIWRSGRVPPGTLACAITLFNTTDIQECQSDGGWKNYFSCTSPDICENITLTNGQPSAKCKLDAAAPTPTPKPTIAVAQCAGGYTLGQEKCENNNVMVCSLINPANASAGVRWTTKENRCTPNTCVENAANKTASCDVSVVVATPTPTLTPTPDPLIPTPTPTIDPNAPDCADGHKPGDVYCDSSLIGFRTDVFRCSNIGGKPEIIGTCNGTLGCQVSISPNEPVGNICLGNTFQPVVKLVKCGVVNLVGQVNPQLGSNCGIPKENPILIDDGTGKLVYAIDENHPYHKCCYANINGVSDSLTCTISNDLPGLDTLKDWFFSWVMPLIDSFPMVWDRSPQALNIGNLLNATAKIPACQSDSVIVNGKKPEEADCLCGLKEEATRGVNYLCNKVAESERDTCINCLKPTKDGGKGGVWTGLGCIAVENEGGFVNSALGLGISIGGATSLLCLMYAAFLYQTSRGNPESLKKARDLIMSCLTGLLMIIFSIFILRLIGYTILRIPGFG